MSSLQRVSHKCPCCGEYMAFVGQQTRFDGSTYNLIHCVTDGCQLYEATHAEGKTDKTWEAWGKPIMGKNGAA